MQESFHKCKIQIRKYKNMPNQTLYIFLLVHNHSQSRKLTNTQFLYIQKQSTLLKNLPSFLPICSFSSMTSHSILGYFNASSSTLRQMYKLPQLGELTNSKTYQLKKLCISLYLSKLLTIILPKERRKCTSLMSLFLLNEQSLEDEPPQDG